ncbi:hypothetical protein CVD28_12360 [Bacillus sp. M6-12]|uniref:VOC family protein n=1 Tax=Bacillus sp. M6-12 TaxID=2054166 RepID=UPI000C78D731|nr:VOC family protein [Bacillus sp. M6-12]PLS17352.1 hypothetical protein CVD28_12360 [Bacillus sp. M6-12]
MKIYHVCLESYNLEEMRHFYTQELDMELRTNTSNSFSVIAGSTEIMFKKAETLPFYHLCFRTSGQYFEHIFMNLDEQNRLVKNESGRKRMYWEGKQAYFTDPDGNILEMLERKYQWKDKEPIGWFDVCEIGMPVFNIKETQLFLSTHLIDVQNMDDDTFAFYGDSSGYLVLVKEGRHWYPTKKSSVIHATEISVSGKENIDFKLFDYPYIFKVRKEKIDK